MNWNRIAIGLSFIVLAFEVTARFPNTLSGYSWFFPIVSTISVFVGWWLLGIVPFTFLKMSLETIKEVLSFKTIFK